MCSITTDCYKTAFRGNNSNLGMCPDPSSQCKESGSNTSDWCLEYGEWPWPPLETRLTDSLLEGLAVHITKMVKARISRWGMAPNTRDSGLRLLLWSAQRCCELKDHMNRLRYPMDLKLTQMLFSHGAPHVLQLLNTTLQILLCSSCRHD